MIGYNLVTAICFALLTAEVLYVIINLCIKDRAHRIAFLRSFKKGKCVLIYLSAIPLYFIGHLYAHQPVLDAFFSAINKIINLVVLKYENSSVSALMSANLFYKVTVYYCYVLIAINALLFALSIFCQKIWQFIQKIKSKFSPKDKLIIFGYNQSSLAIFNSDSEHDKIIVDKISQQDCATLYSQKVSFISSSAHSKHIAEIIKEIRKKDKKCVTIINSLDDEKNLSLSRVFVNELTKYSEEDRKQIFRKLSVFVFGDPRYEALYGDIVSSGFGCIHYINKYQKIAMEFIDRYPFTRFMNETHIDYNTSLLRDGVDVNVCMIGFGKTNRQVFLTSVANNQFLTSADGEIKLKPVNYYIFDKAKSENNKNLNHNYYRFKNECANLNSDEYLPLPESPANEEYCQLDINDNTFYNEVRSIVSRGKNNANFVIIAFGTDLENIDMAQKLVEKRREWNVDFTIFVKSRSAHKELEFVAKENCYFFANEQEEVYDISEITNDNIFRMAQMRNEIYDLEYTITHEKIEYIDDKLIEDNRRAAYEAWYCKKSQLERESSLYCCLSLKSKLHMLGLDYCKKDMPGEALTESEYLQIYAQDDLPDTSTYTQTACGKKIVKYTLDFANSRRTTMAIHEHQRWNSFMLSKGMIPSSKEQILNDAKEVNGKIKHTNGKDYAFRRHGNLTTFEGLVEFRKMITMRDKNDEFENDVIKYDYQLLDDAWWLLNENGYKIIRKSN
ncbi:MAG: hypothetical protein K2J16_01060 [Clostridia bacterium]|nr:hypothetical protein [Clostridia bacterium]